MSAAAATAAPFALGRVVLSRGVHDRAPLAGVLALLQRHRSGDWGSVAPEDAEANDQALRQGARLLSAYELEGLRVGVLIESDRSSTTVLLPEEHSGKGVGAKSRESDHTLPRPEAAADVP